MRTARRNEAAAQWGGGSGGGGGGGEAVADCAFEDKHARTCVGLSVMRETLGACASA